MKIKDFGFMLIPFDSLTKKYHFSPKGVLHVGAHEGQEAKAYRDLGVSKVVWIEGNYRIYRRLLNNLERFDNQIAIHALVSDKEEDITFNIANNDGQSSSILELGTHATVHPEVKYINSEKLRTSRIDNIDYDFSGLDFLNLDIQGAELLALKGMGDMLDQFNYVYTEVNWTELYKGCVLFNDLTKWLKDKGFRFCESRECGNTTWGDAFYMRQ